MAKENSNQVLIREAFLKELGAALRESRKQAGISQTELTVKSGISQLTISLIENGKFNCSLGLLLRICSALGVTLKVSVGDNTAKSLSVSAIRRNSAAVKGKKDDAAD